MTAVVLRCSAAELPALAALRRSWAEEQAGTPIEDAGIEAAFTRWYAESAGPRESWIAWSDEEPIGMVNLSVFTRMPKPGRHVSRWGYVANVFVLPAHRDAGVGGALMEAATAFAREQGFVRLVLSPSARSVPFYARMGFAPATSLRVLDLRD